MDVQHNISQNNSKQPKDSSRNHKAKHNDSECNGNTIGWNGKRSDCIQGNHNNHDRADNPGGNCRSPITNPPTIPIVCPMVVGNRAPASRNNSMVIVINSASTNGGNGTPSLVAAIEKASFEGINPTS